MPDRYPTEDLAEGMKQYLGTNSELLKLEATQKSSIIGSMLIGWIVVGLLIALFILFLSMWAGFYISMLLNNTYAGFAIVACFYFLLVLIMLIGRQRLIETPVREFLIKKLISII